MANVVKRFIKEAICRETLHTYGAVYRLSNGKYYRISTDAYTEKEARRMCKKLLTDSPLHECEPDEFTKLMVKNEKYLYVYDMGKAE
jgi:uncharacterized protein YggL (DUF469 family)